MKIFIKDTEILEIVALYLCHIDVLIMTTYCKSLIEFPWIITEKLSFCRNKHEKLKARNNVVKRNRRSSGYTYYFMWR